MAIYEMPAEIEIETSTEIFPATPDARKHGN